MVSEIALQSSDPPQREDIDNDCVERVNVSFIEEQPDDELPGVSNTSVGEQKSALEETTKESPDSETVKTTVEPIKETVLESGVEEETPVRSRRLRQRRNIPGAIPWNSLE